MKDTVVSLFDLSGIMIRPWLDAGYHCYIVDLQHPPAYESDGIMRQGNLHKVHFDLRHPWLPPFDRERIAFVAAFPPCDHLSVSGSRWFKGKGLRRLAWSVEMFATAAEFAEWSGAPYMIENPVSTISSYWRKADHMFSPHHFTRYCPEDNYTKKTCLWTGGGFKMPIAFQAEGLREPDDRIHKCPPSKDRKNIRSKTPRGFAEAVFHSNSNNGLLVAFG